MELVRLLHIIDFNSAANGVYLPKVPSYKSATAIDEKNTTRTIATHNGKHIKDYMNMINRDFKNFHSKEDALDYIQKLREDLLDASNSQVYLQNGI